MTGGKRGSEGTRERGRESTRKRDVTAGETWNDTGRGNEASRQGNLETKHSSQKGKPKYYTQRNHKTPLIPIDWLK